MMMSVTAAEVAELRRDGEAQRRDDTERVFDSYPEILGFQVSASRALGADLAEQLHQLELLVRATGLDREDVRACRDTLKALGYDPAICKLLTRLARQAKPKARWTYRGRGRPVTEQDDRSDGPQRDNVDHVALSLLRQSKRRADRRR